jgi:dihydroorotate dehydrogenase electron transfer subunit
LLADSTPGGTLDIIGPLGNGFEIEPSKKGRYILIAGGVGIPPILALVRLLISQNLKIEFYYGSRDRDTLIFHDALLSMPIKYYFATDDGSLGHRGFVSEILPDDKSNIACVYACGPLDMLKAILTWCGRESFRYFASIENRMGCGVGVCLGCSIPTADGGYKLTCRDGPVFDADMVSWDKL